MLSIADSTYSKENSPEGKLGVGTMTKVAFVRETAVPKSETAESRSLFDINSSSTLASCSGEMPLFRASTLDLSTSTPITLKPLLAMTTATQKPSFPSPTTDTSFAVDSSHHDLRRVF